MGILTKKLMEIEEAEDSGNWSYVLFLLEQTLALARENYTPYTIRKRGDDEQTKGR
jgi:hypothetical protein